MALKGRFVTHFTKGNFSAFSEAGALLVINSSSSEEMFGSSLGVE